MFLEGAEIDAEDQEQTGDDGQYASDFQAEDKQAVTEGNAPSVPTQQQTRIAPKKIMSASSQNAAKKPINLVT